MSVSSPLGESPAQLAALRERYVPRVYTQHHPNVAVQGEGAFVTDAAGQRYLDFAGGIGVLNVGQRHPKVVAALHEQIDRLLHSGPVLVSDRYIQLAARLSEKVSPDGDKQVLFLNSGAEAVENAVKIARHATGRPAIIAFERAFHGRTLLDSSLNGKVAPYKTQPGSMAPEIYHAPYPYAYRPPKGVAPEDLVEHCLAALVQLVAVQVPREKVAAVIVEPVQGEGGYVVPPQGFLTGVKAFCRSIGALLIVDEIQTGYGRTGRFFAYEWEPVEPDILTVGKSLADGLPLTAVVAGRDIFEKVVTGDVGGTYGGNPVCCAAGLAVLDAFDDEHLLDRAEDIASRVRGALEDVAGRCPMVGEVRGLGTMIAVEFVTDRMTKTPAGQIVDAVVVKAREKGVIVIKAGQLGNVLRVLVPLTATDEELGDGMRALVSAIDEACS